MNENEMGRECSDMRIDVKDIKLSLENLKRSDHLEVLA
jgi:hypothetical protein